MFQNAGKIYLPVYLVILLVRLKRRDPSLHKATVLRTMKDLFNSTIFTAVYAMSIPGSYCYIERIFNWPKNSSTGFALSAIFSCAIFLESTSRWSEISLYVFSQWMEAYVYSLKKRKVVFGMTNWQVIFFYLELCLCSRYRYYHLYLQNGERRHSIETGIGE